MFGNVALMQRPKVAFLSSRRVALAAVMRCYDWATGMRGGGGTPGGSAGRLAPPGDVGHAGCVTLPQRARRPLSQCAAKMAAFPVSAARSASGPYHGRAAICGRRREWRWWGNGGRAGARPSRMESYFQDCGLYTPRKRVKCYLVLYAVKGIWYNTAQQRRNLLGRK